MKNKLRFFLVSALTFVLACLTAAPAAAADYDFTVDGVYYNVVSMSDLTCEVVRGDSEYTGDVVIPEKVAYGVRTFTVAEIGSWAFNGCTGLTSITIPNSVTAIDWDAFRGCTGLTSVTIPNSVAEIGSWAFNGCTGLTSVTIPNSVTEIGYEAFSNCTGLTSVSIGGSVAEIGHEAFSGCTGLTSVSIGGSVAKIGYEAFSGCTSLESVILQDGSGELQMGYGYREWYGSGSYSTTYKGLFCDCPLKNVYVGRNLSDCYWEKTDGDGKFEKYIYYSPFGSQPNLTTVTIGNSVTEIGKSAFSGCSGLTSITIPNSVTAIDWYAFRGCTGLTSITIPNSVTKIGAYAFSGCTGLTSVTCLAKTPPESYSGDFSDNTYLWATLYVPTGTSAAYSSAYGWKNFLIKEVDVPDAIKDITLDLNGETTIFDLQGHRLAQPKKGINIINGKKVLVK